MMTSGRIAAIAVLSICLGFVGGAWFIGSGYGIALFPLPKVAPAALPAPPRVSKNALTDATEAVGVPPSNTLGANSSSLGPRADRTGLIPSPGGTWAIEPRPFESGKVWHWVDNERAIGGDGTINLTTGGVRYLLTQWRRRQRGANDLRPVFFDANGRRMVTRAGASSSSGSSAGSFLINEFHLDPVQHLALAQVAYVGIERVAPDAALRLIRETQREARVKDLAILPPPRLGQPYRFDLSGTDGQPIRADDFKGKAVLFAIWGPDASSMSGLVMAQRLRETYKTDDLVIISVSFSESVEGARELARDRGVAGPMVVIPNDPEIRRIWTDGGAISSIPQFYVIDREGILQFISTPFELKNHVDILFGRATKPFSPEIHPLRGSTKPEG